MAMSAIWRQKTRTALTTLGVILGACMLTMSLSIGQGVRDALDRQFRKNDNLRRIHVYGGLRTSGDDVTGIPAEAIEVKGEMSEERRARIRKLLVQQWRDHSVRRSPIPLNRELIERLEQEPHIDVVQAGFSANGRLAVNGRSIQTGIRPWPIGQEGLRKQLIRGQVPASDSSQAVLVHEFLLYQLGIRGDDEIDRALGRPLRLEIYNHARSPRLLMSLFDAQAVTMSGEESQLLEKATRLLPSAVDKLDLSPSEKESLRQLLQRRDLPTYTPQRLTITGDFVLAGVFRNLEPEEEKHLPIHERMYRFSEVVIPYQAGIEFCERLPRRRDQGYDSLTILVDREENVREVVDGLKSMGLEYYSAVDFVEMVFREVRLIRFATTFIAMVALLVSALGITNTMVTSVLERTQEIGVMKAVGAKDRHIQTIFLVEGALLGMVGSGHGLLIAWLISLPGDSYARQLMSQQTQVAVEQALFVFPVWLLISVPLFSTLVTTLAAFYPARRAAKVDPIVALRHE